MAGTARVQQAYVEVVTINEVIPKARAEQVYVEVLAIMQQNTRKRRRVNVNIR